MSVPKVLMHEVKPYKKYDNDWTITSAIVIAIPVISQNEECSNGISGEGRKGWGQI